MKSRSSIVKRNGFSLVELIVVLAIASILIAFSANSIVHVGTSLSLTKAGDELASAILGARQQAIATGHAAEIRFYDLESEEDDFFITVFQVVYQKADGSYKADTPVWLPGDTGISRNPVFSSFFRSGEPVKMLIRGKAEKEFPAQQDANYIAFRYHPDGSTGLPEEKWFLTLMFPGETKPDEIPKNFYTIQIDPDLGQIQTFRP